MAENAGGYLRHFLVPLGDLRQASSWVQIHTLTVHGILS